MYGHLIHHALALVTDENDSGLASEVDVSIEALWHKSLGGA
jgi:hypothetical protein